MQLNTQQIVLLCLLVSFVTSIATGITTVALMEQAPEPVSNTINRVVERTIERVVEPVKKDKEEVSKQPERIVETVVVNQEDLTVEAVAKNSGSLVQIYEKVIPEPVFRTVGLAVSSNTILVNSNKINVDSFYSVKTKNGNFDISVVDGSKTENFILLRLDDVSQNLTPASFADSNSLQLAQTVISLGGTVADTVSTGIISKLDAEEKNDGSGNTWKQINSITAGVGGSADVVGSVLINLKGNIVGFKSLSTESVGGLFDTSNKITEYLKSQGI